jgi:AraC-like DNA-binding protein
MLGIAYASGFSSQTTFNTTFKKITNQSPSEFKATATKDGLLPVSPSFSSEKG